METLDVRGLIRMIGAGTSLFYVITDNERYSEGIVAQAAAGVEGMGQPYIWTCTEGFVKEGVLYKETIEPLPALDFAMAQPGPAMFLFKDLYRFWANNPFIIRKLKDFAVRSQSNALIVIGEEEAVPEPLREDLVVLYQGLPAIAEIKAHLESLIGGIPLLAQACAADPEFME
ncbi:MAG TPA: hypothetical protein VEI28_00900, partial [Thermodesulfovibrionales bacterium]|nr:hypothetical protein [Thermodesulfovibrionales bacterium]